MNSSGSVDLKIRSGVQPFPENSNTFFPKYYLKVLEVFKSCPVFSPIEMKSMSFGFSVIPPGVLDLDPLLLLPKLREFCKTILANLES